MSDDWRRRRDLLHHIGGVAVATAVAGCPAYDDGEPAGGGGDDGSTDDGDGLDGGDTAGTDTADGDTADDGGGGGGGEETETATGGGTERVTIQSEAGEVVGTLYGSGSCAVVLTPQINRQRDSWAPQAERLAQEYAVLAIDPVQDDRPTSVLAAIDFLNEERSADAVVPIGASVGGEASVVAAAGAGDVATGVVGISASGGEDSASDLRGRSLFVVAEGDGDRFVEAAHALHEEAPEPTELVTYSGSAHGQGLFDSEHGEDLLERIEALIAAACG